jgi:hypothetical protein
MPGEFAFRGAAQQRLDGLDLVVAAIEPALEGIGAIVTGTR